jgi:hypothetical protein
MFDPNIPADHADLTGVMFRGQFQGLKALIDAVSGVTAAVVDSVTTVNPGDPASVSVSVSGGTLHLSFSLPRGNDGAQGASGSNGNDGAPGPQGPPFANAVVDSVTTLNPGEPATVGVIFDGTNVRFTFGIPRGNEGPTGATGLPGEVSQVDLNNALQNTLAQTSNNSNSVSTLDNPFTNDPPTLADLEMMRQAYNDLVLALRRA